MMNSVSTVRTDQVGAEGFRKYRGSKHQSKDNFVVYYNYMAKTGQCFVKDSTARFFVHQGLNKAAGHARPDSLTFVYQSALMG